MNIGEIVLEMEALLEESPGAASAADAEMAESENVDSDERDRVPVPAVLQSP